MPKKMSIEVVQHSDKDYRLIFKNEKLTLRKTFESADDVLRCVFFNTVSSPIFETTRFRIRFGN